MAGMLSESNAQSSGPGPSPHTAPPGAGTPLSGSVSGPEQPQDAQGLKDQATQLVYGERFDKLIEMFQTNGPENFARSMAVAVNTAITELEKTNGPIGPEMAAEIGGDLFVKLLEDMLVKPKDGMAAVVEGVTAEQLQDVLPAILVMYADAHPEVSKQDVQAVMQEVGNHVQSGSPEAAPPTEDDQNAGNA